MARIHPGLDPTASWYSGDAWYLFAIMIEKCGYPTAKHIFETCIEKGAEIETAKAKRAATARQRASAAPMKIPTLKEIDAADRERICIWYARLLTADQHLSSRQKSAVARLTQRYIEFGGFPTDFVAKLPPIPKKRSHRDAVLIGMFDRSNPKSAYSVERKRRGGKLKVVEFAASLVPEYGSSAEHIMRKVKFQRTGS
jgi:hypothetical protein